MRAAPTLACLALLLACAPERTQPNQVLAERLDAGAEFSRLRYFEGEAITINDRCPVRRTPLNPEMPAAYVNGHPVGFC